MSWSDRTSGVKVGDAVAYSATFLRAIGAYTGDLPFARGVVTQLTPVGEITLATVNWGDENIPEKVNVANLIAVKKRGISERS